MINGGAGADDMRGGGGNDTYVVTDIGDKAFEGVGAGIDLVSSAVSFTLGANVERLILTGVGANDGTGNELANIIIGNNAANVLGGASGNDTLRGLAGDDRLNGGDGNDLLVGGTGFDSFLFDTALGASNVDRITDFLVADDIIELDLSVFTGLAGAGTLAEGAFHVGTAAADADDRIIYDNATGSLYYDADGNGAGAAVKFAQVTAETALSNLDFMVVG